MLDCCNLYRMNENVYMRTYLRQITGKQETNNFEHFFPADNYLGRKRTCDRREFLRAHHFLCHVYHVFHIMTKTPETRRPVVRCEWHDDPMTLKVERREPGTVQHLFPLKMPQLQSKSNTVCRELECKSCAGFAWRRYIFDTHT